jgi:polyhydroxybutyrate depolymerase
VTRRSPNRPPFAARPFALPLATFALGLAVGVLVTVLVLAPRHHATHSAAPATSPAALAETPAPDLRAHATPDAATPPADPTIAPADGGSVSAASGTCAHPHEPGDFIESAAAPDGPRSYRLHVPTAAGPLPLVLNFHGSENTARQQETYSGLLPLADADGFVLLSPEGSGPPSGWDIPGIYHDDGIDDVAATLAILDQVEAQGCIDPARVYATGFSNGAQMAALLACERPDRIAAAAPVSGIIAEGCDGTPVPVITFQGTLDENVFYDDSDQAAAQWAAHNGCTGSETEAISANVTRETHLGCAADVVFYTLSDAAHTWPGAPDGAGGIGPTDHDIDATALIWAFFATHPHG